MSKAPIKRLNLVEPTLFDQTGHSYTYAQCLIKANAEFAFDLHVWLDQRGNDLLDQTKCKPHAYFYRPLRQLQKVFLYFKLLRQPGIIFVGTTELWDLKILAYFAKLLKSNTKVFLHFHQFKQSAKKMASLQQIATQQNNFTIIAPTERLANIFSSHGFEKCASIPCPTYHPIPGSNTTVPKFNKVLYAGAARNDKGFSEVINLLEYNRTIGKNTKFEIQISPPSSQRYDKHTQIALSKLYSLPQHNVVLHNDTLDQEAYLDLFKQAICLLIYNQKEYRDKFSAVALDAFYAGCPIITAKNTWMGDVAERYGAGVALEKYTPANIQQAIEHIVTNYEIFHTNAKHAARALTELHDPKHTLEFIQSSAYS